MLFRSHISPNASSLCINSYVKKRQIPVQTFLPTINNFSQLSEKETTNSDALGEHFLRVTTLPVMGLPRFRPLAMGWTLYE